MLTRRFVTCLVRVPEAYAVVREHATTRPGLLVLDPTGRKIGSVGLDAQDAGASLARATAYLERVLASPPQPDDHPEPREPMDLSRTGRFLVLTVDAGSDAEAAGLREGDVLKTVNGRTIRRLHELDEALRTRDEDDYVFDRAGRPVGVRRTTPLTGLRWAFRPDP